MGTIPYPILSDFHPHGEVAKAYGIFNESNGAFLRTTILVDKDGIIRDKVIYSSAGDIDIQDLLDKASKL